MIFILELIRLTNYYDNEETYTNPVENCNLVKGFVTAAENDKTEIILLDRRNG